MNNNHDDPMKYPGDSYLMMYHGENAFFRMFSVANRCKFLNGLFFKMGHNLRY